MNRLSNSRLNLYSAKYIRAKNSYNDTRGMLEPTEIIQVINAFKSVYDFLKEIKKILDKSEKGGWKLFSSKKTETIEKKFKEALIGTKNALESSIWYGKGFAITEECGSKVDRSFHDLMGLLIHLFNDISMRLDPEKLDEKLIEHLIGQLKVLEDYASRFWQIQGISSHQDKQGDTTKIINDFKSRLWDFIKSMEPYLKPRTTNLSKPVA